MAASSFEPVLSETRARDVTGLTATPKRPNGLHPIFEMQLGPVRYKPDVGGIKDQRLPKHRWRKQRVLAIVPRH